MTTEMAENLAARVAKIRFETADGRVFLGSGFLLARGLVLTARHIVTKASEYDADGRVPARRFTVKLEGSASSAAAVTEIVPLEADGLDAALLIVPDLDEPRGTATLGGTHHGVQTLENCRIIGYPVAGVESGSTSPRPIVVRVNLAPVVDDDTAIEIQVIDPRPRADEDWGGISGAGVIGPGGHLLGIVTSVPTQWDGRLRGVSIAAVQSAARQRAANALEPLQRLPLVDLSARPSLFGTESWAGDPPRLPDTDASLFAFVNYRYRQVEFVNDGPSGAVLDSIVDWANDLPQRPDIRIGRLTGPAGVGKSRIAAEACRRLTRDRRTMWQAGFADYDKLAGTHSFVTPHFIVFDYAEHQHDMLGMFIENLYAQAINDGHLGASIRLLVITRSEEAWPGELRTRTADLPSLLTGSFDLTTQAFDEQDVRERHAEAAYRSFSKAVGGPDAPRELPAEEVRRIAEYDRPLLVHVAALLAASGRAVPISAADDSARLVLDTLIDVEVDRLARSSTAHTDGASALADRGRAKQALCVMTLTAPTVQDLVELLESTPAFEGEPERTRSDVANALHRRYPAAAVADGAPGALLAPIEPDLIASHLLATTEGRAALVERLVVSRAVAAHPAYLARLLNTLALATDDYPEVSDDLRAHLGQSLAQLVGSADASQSLSELLQAHLRRLVDVAVELAGRQDLRAARQLTTALGLPYLTGADVINEAAYHAHYTVPHPHEALDGLGAALAARGVDYRAASGEPEDVYAVYLNYGNRLRYLGEATRALDAVRTGIDYLERAVKSGRRDRRETLAAALHNLAGALSAADEYEEALRTAGRAVDLLTELAAEDRGKHLHFLSLAQGQYSAELRRAERAPEALTVSRQAFQGYEELAHWGHKAYRAYLPYMTQITAGLADALARNDEPNESLMLHQYSAFLAEELVDQDRAASLSELAAQTNGLAVSYYVLGRMDDAVAANSRTVAVYEELVEDDKERYLRPLLRAYETAIRFRCAAGQDLETALRICNQGRAIAESLEKTNQEFVGDLGFRLRMADTDLGLKFTRAMKQTIEILIDQARGRLHRDRDPDDWQTAPPIMFDGTSVDPATLDGLEELKQSMEEGDKIHVYTDNRLLPPRLEELVRFIRSEPAIGFGMLAAPPNERLGACLRALPSVAEALQANVVDSSGQEQLDDFLAIHGYLSRLDPDDRAHWGSFKLAVGALGMLGGSAVRLGAQSEIFRAIVPGILRYTYLAGDHLAGLTTGWFIKSVWDAFDPDDPNSIGPDDPDFIALNDRFAGNVYVSGDHGRALALWKDVVHRRERVLGPDHQRTIVATGNLAGCLVAFDEFDQAEDLYESAIERGRRVLELDHPDVLRLRSNQAGLLFRRGRYDEALLRQQDLLQRYKNILGADHQESLGAAGDLALTLLELKRYAHAQVLAEDTLERAQRIFGVDDPRTRRYEARLEQINEALEAYEDDAEDEDDED
ncbi:tetratricopeptide repeat protein [Streptomyces sp. DG2A-72]|uniref:tetratricopeptide repeat protein n=1 Tax=Streptomyces sp. DG2A-72 TaxID=3051386 RepID=UPI00265B80FD|nr:tetratricopeptide repeat protein [Streptomyces sp. DG2A-72]MDO0932986.1 tetratricopeptide repeat protein [Streptomyces sp. DG2A-72]